MNYLKKLILLWPTLFNLTNSACIIGTVIYKWDICHINVIAGWLRHKVTGEVFPQNKTQWCNFSMWHEGYVIKRHYIDTPVLKGDVNITVNYTNQNNTLNWNIEDATCQAYDRAALTARKLGKTIKESALKGNWAAVKNSYKHYQDKIPTAISIRFDASGTYKKRKPWKKKKKKKKKIKKKKMRKSKIEARIGLQLECLDMSSKQSAVVTDKLYNYLYDQYLREPATTEKPAKWAPSAIACIWISIACIGAFVIIVLIIYACVKFCKRNGYCCFKGKATKKKAVSAKTKIRMALEEERSKRRIIQPKDLAVESYNTYYSFLKSKKSDDPLPTKSVFVKAANPTN